MINAKWKYFCVFLQKECTKGNFFFDIFIKSAHLALLFLRLKKKFISPFRRKGRGGLSWIISNFCKLWFFDVFLLSQCRQKLMEKNFYFFFDAKLNSRGKSRRKKRQIYCNFLRKKRRTLFLYSVNGFILFEKFLENHFEKKRKKKHETFSFSRIGSRI